MAARSARPLRLALFPPLLLATIAVHRCELSTAPGTFELRLSGTIHFREVNGGCWELEVTDGRRYEVRPSDLPEAARRDGARVTLVATPRRDATGACGLGTVLEVDEVLRVEGG